MKTVHELLKLEPNKLTKEEKQVVKRYKTEKVVRHAGDFISHATHIPEELTKKKDLDSYVEIRCPFSRVHTDGNVFKCQWRCVRVAIGSEGEAWCIKCKKPFNFKVDSQSQYNPTVKVQHE